MTNQPKLTSIYDTLSALANSDAFTLDEVIADTRRWLEDRTGDSKPKRENFSKGQIRKAWQRQGHKCGYCPKILHDPNDNYKLDLEDRTYGDHRQAASKGGPATDENCVASCWGCNSKKGDKDLISFSKSTGKLLTEMNLGSGQEL